MDPRETLDTRAPEIAAALRGWKHVRDNRHGAHWLIPEEVPEPFDAFRGDTLGIRLREGRHGRLEISGKWPSAPGTMCVTPFELPYGANGMRPEAPHISVALTRPPEAIAREIGRRFLPSYLDLHKRCVAMRDARDHAEQERQRVLVDFAALVDTQPRDKLVHWYHDKVYALVEVDTGGEHARLELRGDVTILQAALLAAKESAAV